MLVKLSIPFMGYSSQEIQLTNQLATFNSLYGIPASHLISNSGVPVFQFPLWDKLLHYYE